MDFEVKTYHRSLLFFILLIPFSIPFSTSSFFPEGQYSLLACGLTIAFILGLLIYSFKYHKSDPESYGFYWVGLSLAGALILYTGYLNSFPPILCFGFFFIALGGINAVKFWHAVVFEYGYFIFLGLGLLSTGDFELGSFNRAFYWNYLWLMNTILLALYFLQLVRSQAVDTANSYLRTLNNISDGVMYVDLDHIVEYVNPRFCEIIGYSQEELLGKNVTEMLLGKKDQKYVKSLGGKRKLGESSRYELEVIKKNGDKLLLAINGSPLFDKNQKLVGTIGIHTDITEQSLRKKELENYAHQLEDKNLQLERFAYIASHDLQEPLRTVNSFVQLLERKEQNNLSKEGKEYLGFIVNGAQRMHRLVSDLLEYSRTGSQSLIKSEIDPGDLIKSLKSDLAFALNEENVSLEIDNMQPVYADKVLLRQLIQNLVDNAIKYNSCKDPIVRVSSRIVKDGWLLIVSDNGIGIAEEYKEKIFQVFKRLHNQEEYSGTGIGLAICKKIVDQHSGKIWVESELGLGSSFYVLIPNQLPKKNLGATLVN